MLKQLLVLLLLGVEEDHVEDIVDRGERLEGIAGRELGPLVEPGLLDVAAPGVDFCRIVLEREDPAAEVADTGREPDRRVAARAADLEHLAVGLRRDEREEELPRRPLDRPRAQLAPHAFGPLARVLGLEARERGADAIVEHGAEPTGPLKCSRAPARPHWVGVGTVPAHRARVCDGYVPIV